MYTLYSTKSRLVDHRQPCSSLEKAQETGKQEKSKENENSVLFVPLENIDPPAILSFWKKDAPSLAKSTQETSIHYPS